MQTCNLYHGPDAEETCYQEALNYGALLRKPFGLDGQGLKKDEAREIARLNRLGALNPCSLIVGRLDHAPPASSDALLKVIEEPFEKVRIFLWASDLGGVSPTIKSRCHAVWCGGAEESSESLFDGRELYERWADRDIFYFVSVLGDNKGSERDLVEALLAEYANSILNDPLHKEMSEWLRLRELLMLSSLTPSQVIDGLFGGSVK
jgi:hypothetical protein